METTLCSYELKGTKFMYELNEQELEQVAGGTSSFSLNLGTQAGANGGFQADHGIGVTSAVTGSTFTSAGSNSFAATRTFAAGSDVIAVSSAASTGGLTINASH
jgi:hypothetical protein